MLFSGSSYFPDQFSQIPYFQIGRFHIGARIGGDQDRCNAERGGTLQIAQPVIDEHRFPGGNAAFVQRVEIDAPVGFECADEAAVRPKGQVRRNADEFQLLFNARPGVGDNAELMCSAQFREYFRNAGIGNIVFQIAGAITGDLFTFRFRQIKTEPIGDQRVVHVKLPDLLFHRRYMMILFKKAQAGFPGVLDLCVAALRKPPAGQIQKQGGKHPVPGSGGIQGIPHIEEDHFFILQLADHAVPPSPLPGLSDRPEHL